ncbi:PaaI family thioesterase [Ruegeria sp. WL0004]|uniref:PaaI family thioesterase n=1 Tax=Ruegeria marisflavi TaxID=2984152 RepID=A0ABT2WNJ1_9RHOB|nr:PaaI family thioesterase [Ruegeria sp. WL0004]MCU9836802.1 PaaI family thioesterase [Ruegeria sp. WL0004]
MPITIWSGSLPSVPPDLPASWTREKSGCQSMVGYELDHDRAGVSRACHLDLGPQHLNYHGILHGGLVSMLLDVACGQTASAMFRPEDPIPVVTVSLNVQFVAAARGGRVTAVGIPSGNGRTLAYVNGELRDEDGRLLATAAGVFKRGSLRKKS